MASAASLSKVEVRLSDHQRQVLSKLVRTGTHPAAQVRRAQVLLKADADGPDAWSDPRIGKAVGCSFMTVRRVRAANRLADARVTPGIWSINICFKQDLGSTNLCCGMCSGTNQLAQNAALIIVQPDLNLG